MKPPLISAPLLAEFESILEKALQSLDLRAQYHLLNGLLRDVLDALTSEAPFNVSTPLAQVSYVSQRWLPLWHRHLNALRRHCRERQRASAASLAGWWREDFVTMRALLSVCNRQSPGTPPDLQVSSREPTDAARLQDYARAVVVEAEEQWNPLVELTEEGREVRLILYDLASAAERTWKPEFAHLRGHLRPGVELNLIHPQGDGDVVTPLLIVYEPDYLVNISEIAGCFKPYADCAELSFLNRMETTSSTQYTVRGNLAGALFDEALQARRSSPPTKPSYKEAAQCFFRHNKLDIATTPGIDAAWHRECLAQLGNIEQSLLALEADEGKFNAGQAITEASFVCEAYGLSGRTDMITRDKRCLIEQKSGKMEEWGGYRHKEEHWVQIELYELMLRSLFGLVAVDTSLYLLYSHYGPREGLVLEGGVAEAGKMLSMRNRMVQLEELRTDAGRLRKWLSGLTVDWFRQKPLSDKFWAEWMAPQIERSLGPLQGAEAVELDYFCEMTAFVAREAMLAKKGSRGHADRGFANLWLLDASERREQGNLLDGLRVVETRSHPEWGNGVRLIVVELPVGPIPQHNFRAGDVVILYSHRREQRADVRKVINHRGTLVEVTERRFTVFLRSPQEARLFTPGEKSNELVWSLECDHLEATSTGLLKQLSLFMCGAKERRDLLLCRREPRFAPDATPLLDHGAMNALVERFVRCRDMLLIVGPPGTGKTSFALMSLVREELATPGHSLLLVAQTNRAVDEICSKLDQDNLDYIRLGTYYGTGEHYREHLLNEGPEASATAVRARLEQVRIVTATVATLMSATNLLRVKRFSTAIVDEASQLVEPQLVGLLTAPYTGFVDAPYGSRDVPSAPGTSASVERFVLIGDERQLGPVVVQKGSESRISSQALRLLGVRDCREALFGRLLRRWRDDARICYQLTAQGRMHPAVAEFSNRMFYSGRLTAVGLAHQRSSATLEQLLPLKPSQLDRTLCSRRLLFLDSSDGCAVEAPRFGSEVAADTTHTSGAADSSGKTNLREAVLVSRVVWSVLRMREASGEELTCQTLGVVVPYRAQIGQIREALLSRAFGKEEEVLAEELTIDTVERFQGSERSVIVYGTTVSRPSQLRFLTESQYTDERGRLVDRKLNVALTRAREQTIVVGDARILEEAPLYAKLIAGFRD